MGRFNINGIESQLPSEEQQADNEDFPDLDDVSPSPTQTPDLPAPPQSSHDPNIEPGYAHNDADRSHFSTKQCSNQRCQVPSTNGTHDDGDPRHSFERLHDGVHGPPANRLRRRNLANISAAIASDNTGVLEPAGHASFVVAVAGDGPDDMIEICYNTELTDYGNVSLVQSTGRRK